MKKNGFTLVELLAILIILAIIIVILIPKINSITEKSRIDGTAASALGYIDAVEKFYVDETQKNVDNDIVMNGNYDVTNGSLSNGNDDYYIKTKGVVPSNGYLAIKNGDVLSGCLTIGKYQVEVVDEVVSSVKVGDCSSLWNYINSLTSTLNDDGYKYLSTPITVYYDPLTGNSCESGSTGCMKWFAYSFKNNDVNMILDRNMTLSGTGVKWISSDDYSNNARKGKELGVTNMGVGNYGDGNNDKGPLTALDYLKTNTSSWVTRLGKDYISFTANIDNASYKISYSSYKARLITAEEIAYINGVVFEDSSISSLSSFLYDNLSTTDGIYGYWTCSPNSTDKAWSVIYSGSLSDVDVSNDSVGIRPVITVSPSIVFKY